MIDQLLAAAQFNCFTVCCETDQNESTCTCVVKFILLAPSYIYVGAMYCIVLDGLHRIFTRSLVHKMLLKHKSLLMFIFIARCVIFHNLGINQCK